MGEGHIVAFLSDLAVRRNCSPGTQNQALNALVFLFRHVLNRDIGEFKGIVWAPLWYTLEATHAVLR